MLHRPKATPIGNAHQVVIGLQRLMVSLYYRHYIYNYYRAAYAQPDG